MDHQIELRRNISPQATSRRLSRRALVGTVAWSAPVIVAATAAPALAASGASVLSRTSPATATFTSGDVGYGPLTVTLLNGTTAVSGKQIVFVSGASWIQPAAGAVTTNASGVASTVLNYASVPPLGSTTTLLATYQDLQVSWTVTYQPLTVQQRIALGNTVTGSRQVRGVVVGYQTGTSAVQFTGPFTTAQDTNLVIADSVAETAVANTIPVELPTSVRTSNALPTTTRYHDVIDVTGNAVAYFGKAGMKDDTLPAGYGINLVSEGA
jgi:hypothetical protein